MTGPIQYQRAQDGSWQVSGLDGVSISKVEIFDDTEPVFDWLQALGIEKDREKISQMAVPAGFSSRFLRVIVCDESPTKLGFKFQPPQLFVRERPPLTLGHIGYAVGEVQWLQLGGLDEAVDVEGDYIWGIAQLFDSALADAAWRGIQGKIFQHVCAVVLRPSSEPAGTGEIVEVALTDRPGSPGARILEKWQLPPL
jgi:hypothetical protein